MKKARIFPILAFLAFLSFLPLAMAAGGNPYVASKEKPALTQPAYIAMLFHKLGGKMPDFAAWEKQTGGDAAAMRDTFSLLTVHDSIAVEMPVRLSAYNAANKGFLVQNIRPATFFPFTHAGQGYAVVPGGIMEQQWLKVSDENTARQIDEANLRGGLTMVLMLQPKYTDTSAPVPLEGQDYWLISSEVQKVMLFAPDSDTPLWQPTGVSADEQKRQELLNLRK